jgi:hypothetical protein
MLPDAIRPKIDLLDLNRLYWAATVCKKGTVKRKIKVRLFSSGKI